MTPSSFTSSTNKTSLMQVGAGLGVASNCVGLAIFLMMCAGFDKAVVLALIPFGLACVGFVLSIVGPVVQKDIHHVDTHVLAAVFVNLFGIVGGLVLLAVWRGWPLFFK